MTINPRRPYLLIALVALLIRLAVVPFVYTDWTDPFVLTHWAYGLVARSLVTGHGFSSVFAPTGAPTAVLPPVYTCLLACLFKIFGPETKASILAALSLNSLFSALTCIPVFIIAKQNFGDRVAKWAAWGWAFSPYGIYYGADWAWSTPLVTLELACLFLFALRLEKNCRRGDWLLYGALCGISALTEPVTLAVLPLLGLWTLYRRFRANHPWKLQILAAAFAGTLVLAPWIARNYAVFHRFIPVRSGLGLELYIGNNGYSQRWVASALHPNHSDAELAEYERAGEMAYMDHKLQQGKSYIRAHPGWYAWMTARRIVYLWTGYWSFSRDYLKDEPLDPPNIVVGTTMSILGLLGLHRILRRPVSSPPVEQSQCGDGRLTRQAEQAQRAIAPHVSLAIRFAIVLFFFPLPYYFTHPETYYFRPVDPLIVILAAVAVTSRRSYILSS